MEVREIVLTVLASDPDHWTRIHSWPHDVFRTASGERQDWFERAVYRPDAAISLVWGVTLDPTFEEAWATRFPDRRATSESIFVLYNGQPVHKDFAVSVDGGHAYLPAPNAGTSEVPSDRYRLVRLIDALMGHDRFEEYVERAGLTTLD